MTTIRSLVVFKTLKVHQLVVEPKRVKATYTIVKKDNSEVCSELIYSYNDRYFDPKNASDVNLASMMVAQVALNYGLFFETILFDGWFDETDSRFIRDMTENTSREILVHKFFSKNEFLKAPFDTIQREKLERYTAANIVFVNTQFASLELIISESAIDRNAYAILSSGGKDSLLTYGLIKEIGEPHPVFINESGRHWFTAVNAHQYFRAYEPNTVKPWCNSDRIFNWMVKQMPFIKENFQNIRSDSYPIRLWTVAVFLFGVLPVVRKRGLGNVLIGNEYDTTIKGNYQGITHYHGLYDQSKYFDNAMTRYYRRKGWDVYQYSLLRSLSELLILKILVKRYPDLQTLQVSCHAAHEENGKMRPCGNCEKCRRIVGMLSALDEDPKRCGYTDSQIQKALKTLAQRSVKQLGSDAAQLYHLLLSKAIIETNDHTKKLAKEHKEIMMLRFDKERSTLADLPTYIRRPLFAILAKYSEGAVQFQDRKWQAFTIKNDNWGMPHFLDKNV
ncbi:hypothetical protein FK220_004085 [Flavobacteriaceae bacterium TP-CH-4]|uniref:Uncharacterized protein n=1 Tax=Pelagihabitans pacificus TaxID=2696054 RepID=A0A967ECP6_9FLAO|nr:hypothetical protein [Pelagihabitans pacificus]NHF58503.1 hypothetical protein [Pelagihabitans pacificus]